MKPIVSEYFSSLFGFELNEDQSGYMSFPLTYVIQAVEKCIFCSRYSEINWACDKCDAEGHPGSKAWGDNDPDYYLVIK